MDFAFATSRNIQFGPGVSKKIPSLLPQETRKAFILTGSEPYRNKAILDLLEKNGIELKLHSITTEPTIEIIDNAVLSARSFSSDIVISIGGGSVIDAGKAVAALLSNPGRLIDFLEVVGKGHPLSSPSSPFMAVPTTAGTGAEVTKNSVIGVPEAGVKVSMRSAYMLPDWAIIDPELTHDLPPEIAAYSGMDALIQCVEPYLSKFANPLSDAVSREGIRQASKSLRRACEKTVDREAKESMCIASLCGGLSLANSKLGAVHGFAGPLGGMIDAPHGAICAALFLPVMRANYAAAEIGKGTPQLKDRFDEIAQILTGNQAATGKYAIAWIESLISELPIKTLKELGFTENRISEAAEKAAAASSMKGNPIEFSIPDLKEILDEALNT